MNILKKQSFRRPERVPPAALQNAAPPAHYAAGLCKMW